MAKMLDFSEIDFLIVDGNPNISGILTTVLEFLGAKKITAVDSTDDAYNYLSKKPIDIVLTEWMVEPLAGLAFIRKLRNSMNTDISMLPIIMLTAYSEKSRITEARDAGVSEFLSQPTTPLILYSRLADLIQNPRMYIRTGTFFGPDRRRLVEQTYIGTHRREEDFDSSIVSKFSKTN